MLRDDLSRSITGGRPDPLGARFTSLLIIFFRELRLSQLITKENRIVQKSLSFCKHFFNVTGVIE